jgi:nitrogen fixation NifU-like protein
MTMSSLIDLYQDTILEHSQSPRKSNSLKIITDSKTSKNPLCGDIVTLEVLIEEGIIKDVACKTNGCAISTAAGSIMSTEIIGKTTTQALEICENFITALKEKIDFDHTSEELCILSKVSEYPSRIKCATLPWLTLKNIIEEKTSLHLN